MKKLFILFLLGLNISAYAGWHKTLIVCKGADETRTQNAVMTNDASLYRDLATGSTYFFTMDLHFNSDSATPDAKFMLVEPVVGSTISAVCVIREAPSTTTINDYELFGSTVTIALSGSAHGTVSCRGTMAVKTGGIFRLQWAQNTSNATATTLDCGGTMRFENITLLQ